MRFQGEEIVLVTGASSGIGEATALLLNRLGATVIGTARSAEKLQAVKGKAVDPARLLVEPMDIAADISTLGTWVKTLREKYGRLAGLVSCAGVAEIVPLRMWEVAAAKKLYDLNLFAPLALLKAFVDKRNNVGAGASCVFVASAAAQLADKGMANYSGSKAALVASCRAAAKEVAPLGIRINCVSPTVIRTPMTAASGEEYAEEQNSRHPMGLGAPEDVANTIAFLLSDKAKWTAGQNYTIDCASF